MLFNSYAFIFWFLPIVFFGFYCIGRYSHSLAGLWLCAASLFFYGWWDARFVGLLLSSIVFNYGVGYLIGHGISQSGWGARRRTKLLLAGGIAANLALLGYYKYVNFFIENINMLAGTSLPIGGFFLPLGISFFTFTQIAFLVDTYQGKVKEYHFVYYALFVTYFPHLIAGPVLHHKEMMPQFARRETSYINWDNVAVGFTIFVIGLAKKLIIADSLADLALLIFNALKAGELLKLFEAWAGAIAYTLQLYFDFSGYSDMAIGLSLMFNVRLPVNFNSPYKATSIIEFWRRWHLTLSRFMRDYLYIPLGGNRRGKVQRYLNLMVTMVLGGLWHGAGWTFIIWGGLHGFYLMVNHAWRAIKERMLWSDGGKWSSLIAGTLTFIAVVVGWVFFRADSISSAIAMLSAMIGMNGVSLPSQFETVVRHYLPDQSSLVFLGLFPVIVAPGTKVFVIEFFAFVIVWGAPNVRQMFRNYRPVYEDMHGERNIPGSPPNDRTFMGRVDRAFIWKLERRYAWAAGVLFALAILHLSRVTEFIYFQF